MNDFIIDVNASKHDVEPKIWVGTYHKYNSGKLIGEWLEVLDFEDASEFLEACKELHSDESDPEFMFNDFEGFPKMFYSESFLNSHLWVFLDWIEDNRNSDLMDFYAYQIEDHYNFYDFDNDEDFEYWLDDNCPYLTDVDQYDIIRGFIMQTGYKSINKNRTFYTEDTSEKSQLVKDLADDLISYIDFDSVVRNLSHTGYNFYKHPSDSSRFITDFPCEAF